MAEVFTKTAARNIYIGGSVFFILFFLGLTFETTRSLPERDHRENLTASVEHGKLLWEENNCIGCHTLMGEGAYFAPELANVFDRRGAANEEVFKAYLKAWMGSQPLGVPGRRAMPQFNLTAEEVDNLADFLIWTSRIDDNNWPPNIEG